MFLGYRLFNIKLFLPKQKHIFEQFKYGWYIFLSTISMSLYRNSNVFILGFFLSPSLVGVYSGAEKIIKAFQALVSPVSNALFPFVSTAFKKQSKIQQWKSIKKMCIFMGVGLIFLASIACYSAPLANRILLDNLDLGAIRLIYIMSPVIFFGGLNYILGIVGLVNAGAKKAFFHCVMISGIASIILLLLLIKYFGVYSAAISMTICEIILFILSIWKWLQIKYQKI